MWIFAILLVTKVLASSGSSSNDVPQNIPVKTYPSQSFTFRLYNRIAGSSGPNDFFSPLSISLALKMLHLGARNETANQIEQLLSNDKIQADPHQLCNSNKFHVANGLFVEDNFTIHDSYVNDLKQRFCALVKTLNFRNSSQEAMLEINSWARKETRGKIPQLLTSPPSPNTVLMLLNALHFKGTWETKFDPSATKPRVFYNRGFEKKLVDMMETTSYFRYYHDLNLDFQAVELPYSNKDLNFLLVVPNKRRGLSDLEPNLTDELINKIMDSAEEQLVLVGLPKFRLATSYSLSESMKEFGLRNMFDPNLSDFSGIAASSKLFVSEIFHKSAVEVNEEGTEAASVTGISMDRTGFIPLVQKVLAEHPFLFVIRDKSTNLFVGRISQL